MTATPSSTPTFADDKTVYPASFASSKEPLLPSTSGTASRKKRTSPLNGAQLFALGLLALQLYFFVPHALLRASSAEPQLSLANIQGGPGCVQPPPTPIRDADKGRSDVFLSDEFRKTQVERLLGAIRMPTETVSHNLERTIN